MPELLKRFFNPSDFEADKRKKPRISEAVNSGADNGARTRDPNLGKVVLYQLSHVRKWWAIQDLNL